MLFAGGDLSAIRRQPAPVQSSRCGNTFSTGRRNFPIYRRLLLCDRPLPQAQLTIPAAVAASGEAVVQAPALDPPCGSPSELALGQGGEPWEASPAPQQWTPPAGRPGLYDASGRLVLKSLTLPELEAWCASEGEEAPAKRALQVWRWMYADPPAGAWVRTLEETLGRQNGFSAKFIDKVGPRVSLDGGLQLSRVVRAADGTRKLVFTLTEGEAKGGSVETVLIPIVRQKGLRDRLTICVSSQVGCAMNCQFCYTGRMGLLGNLTTAQIVEQVVEARRFLAQEGERTQLTNMVFMGMGEPLHNTEAVLAAADIVSHYLGLHLSHNKITISTVGLVPEMRTVMARSRVQMALSLHATTDEVRDWIVPVNRRYDLATLTAALEELFPRVDLPPGQQHQRHSSQLPQEPQPVDRSDDVEHHLLQGPSQSEPGTTQEGSELERSGTVAASRGPAHEDAAGAAGTATVGRVSELNAGRWLAPLELCTTADQHDMTNGSVDSRASTSTSSVGSASSPGSDELVSSRDDSNSLSNAVGTSSTSSSGRSLLVEYTMLRGINDTLADAHRLADMLARVNCKVNLIVFNPHAGTRFQPSTDADVSAFRSALVQRGLVCTIRDSRGDDEMAACGQLGNVGLAFRPSPILEAPERFKPFLLTPVPANTSMPAMAAGATPLGAAH